tara:strand:+ start:209 stop:964 length:756 start_codon:yes stop_codon:yes gene_type:complete
MIPKELKPSGLYDLIRIGKDNDGGYLVCKNSVYKSDVLISFGISDDFSFEEQFQKLNNVKIFAYDPTTTNNFFLKQFLHNILKLNFIQFFNKFNNYIKFKNFFKKKNNHFFLKKIGKGGSISYKHISINEILKLSDDKSNFFFKIDIETSEYRILEDLIYNMKNIEGVVIEFHDVDLHILKIVNFIKEFELKLIHIHANNWADYGENNIPTSIELSFSKNPVLVDQNLILPHKLDQRNNPDAEDIKLIFNT